MRAILVLSALGLAFTPIVAATASVDAEGEGEADMVDWDHRLRAYFNESRFMETFFLEADLKAGVAPEESATAPGLETILAFLAQLAILAPSTAVVAQEAQSVYTEGAATEAEARSTASGTTLSTRTQAGGHEVAKEETVSPPPEPEPAPWMPLLVEPQAAPAPPPQAEPAPSREVPSEVSAESAAVALPDVPLPIAAAATLAIATASGGAGLALLPGWRSGLVKLLKRFGWLGLFSRIAQEDILNHERRAELLEFVRNNPGERVEYARRSLGFSNGSMHYHLCVLTARNLIRVHREGIVARLFPAGPRIQPAPYVPTIRRKYLDALSARPGITQRELATTMGVSERMVSYHVGTLAEQGFVAVQHEGGRKRLFIQATPA